MNLDLFGTMTKAEIKRERGRKIRLGRKRKEKLLDAECAWHRLRARVHGHAIARSEAAGIVARAAIIRPAEYEDWSEGQRLRWWHQWRTIFDAGIRERHDDDERIKMELARADRAYARRRAAILAEHQRAVAEGRP